jgi:DNA-binding transcriptional ArsR family regulator
MSDVQPIPRPLPDAVVELVAQRFRVLGEPMRIKVLDRLSEGGASVGELQAALGASQQNISKHLGILHAAGMVSRTKDGNRTVYEISDPAVYELCDHVCGSLRRRYAELEAILP